jgi:hypothetical protein
MLLLVACGGAAEPEVDIEATVGLKESLAAITTPTAIPTWTPEPTWTPTLAPAVTAVPERTPTPTPTPTPAPTPTPVPPTATPTPTPNGQTVASVLRRGRISRKQPSAKSEVEGLDFNGFTHFPVDFNALFSGSSYVSGTPQVIPFFNYSNPNHPEGPKKWYIYGPSNPLMKVYLPVRGVLKTSGIRIFSGTQGRESSVNGEKVFVDIQVWFEVSPDVEVFYMHLTLRDEIKREVEESPNGYVVFEAGTHIGYIYNDYFSLDFGVEDKTHDSGQTDRPSFWWTRRVNPLDYFTDGLRQSILDAYQPVLHSLKNSGTTPYSNFEDSRSNINIPDTIWGVWFKDDLSDAFDVRVDWAVINFAKREFLHQDTYWKVLQSNPTLSGLFTESVTNQVQGTYLYDGAPMGVSRLFILSGDEKAGVARIDDEWGEGTTFLKYEVSLNTESKFDDKLVMESFSTYGDAENRDFSVRAVTFRRMP